MFGKKQKPEVEPDGGLALDGLTADQEAPVPSEEFRAAFEAADNVIKGRQEAEARALAEAQEAAAHKRAADVGGRAAAREGRRSSRRAATLIAYVQGAVAKLECIVTPDPVAANVEPPTITADQVEIVVKKPDGTILVEPVAPQTAREPGDFEFYAAVFLDQRRPGAPAPGRAHLRAVLAGLSSGAWPSNPSARASGSGLTASDARATPSPARATAALTGSRSGRRPRPSPHPDGRRRGRPHSSAPVVGVSGALRSDRCRSITSTSVVSPPESTT
jgi:hypothetical protein